MEQDERRRASAARPVDARTVAPSPWLLTGRIGNFDWDSTALTALMKLPLTLYAAGAGVGITGVKITMATKGRHRPMAIDASSLEQHLGGRNCGYRPQYLCRRQMDAISRPIDRYLAQSLYLYRFLTRPRCATAHDCRYAVRSNRKTVIMGASPDTANAMLASASGTRRQNIRRMLSHDANSPDQDA